VERFFPFVKLWLGFRKFYGLACNFAVRSQGCYYLAIVGFSLETRTFFKFVLIADFQISTLPEDSWQFPWKLLPFPVLSFSNIKRPAKYLTFRVVFTGATVSYRLALPSSAAFPRRLWRFHNSRFSLDGSVSPTPNFPTFRCRYCTSPCLHPLICMVLPEAYAPASIAVPVTGARKPLHSKGSFLFSNKPNNTNDLIGLCILLRVYQSISIETSVRNKCWCTV
jgi:hypothetical protein